MGAEGSMCGRYHIDDGRDNVELNDIIEAVNRRVVTEPVKTSGDVFPTDIVPVVATNRRMEPAAFAMRWGYALEDGRRIINARSETAETKPLFRDGMLNRRCAIPATNYYEWARRSREKTRYAIRPAEGDLFYMAGIYRLEAGRPVFTILTREPAESIAFIHDRMPVILPSDLVKDWIDPRYRAAELLEHAILAVTHEREPGAEQLSMQI